MMIEWEREREREIIEGKSEKKNTMTILRDKISYAYIIRYS